MDEAFADNILKLSWVLDSKDRSDEELRGGLQHIQDNKARDVFVKSVSVLGSKALVLATKLLEEQSCKIRQQQVMDARRSDSASFLNGSGILAQRH